jgi:4-aminobutyrate aminotransferase-like enzyme
MSHHQHGAVSTDAEGKKHLTVLQNLDSATVRKLHHEYVMPATFHYYPESLVLQRGEGMFLTDADGVKYLDFFGGILTVSLGHCHPEVVAAVREQLGILGHTSTLYQNEWIVRLAQRAGGADPRQPAAVVLHQLGKRSR